MTFKEKKTLIFYLIIFYLIEGKLFGNFINSKDSIDSATSEGISAVFSKRRVWFDLMTSFS